MKNNSGKWLSIVTFLGAVIYSVVLFLLKKDFDLSSWILYGATMIAFLLVGVQAISIGTGSERIFFNAFNIFTVVYFSVQFLIGGVMLMFFHGLPVTPVLVGEILLLAAYLVFVILRKAAVKNSSGQENTEQRAVQKLRTMESNVRFLIDRQKDPEIKKALESLAEEIHYSSPVSDPSFETFEDKLLEDIQTLQEELIEGKGYPMVTIESIERLVKDRNQMAAEFRRK